jgi:hypothetical protein
MGLSGRGYWAKKNAGKPVGKQDRHCFQLWNPNAFPEVFFAV